MASKVGLYEITARLMEQPTNTSGAMAPRYRQHRSVAGFEFVCLEKGLADFETVHYNAFYSGTEAVESGSAAASRSLFYRKNPKYGTAGALGGPSYITPTGSQTKGRTFGITTGTALDQAVFVRFWDHAGALHTSSALQDVIALPTVLVDPYDVQQDSQVHQVYESTIGKQAAVGGVNDMSAFINRQDYSKTTEELWNDAQAELVRTADGGSVSKKNFAPSLVSFQVMKPRANRRGGSIYNDTRGEMYINLGTTVSPSNFTAKMFYGDLFDLPAGWSGPVAVVWTTIVSGTAQVTEYF